jgi:hypothetical protein
MAKGFTRQNGLAGKSGSNLRRRFCSESPKICLKQNLESSIQIAQMQFPVDWLLLGEFQFCLRARVARFLLVQTYQSGKKIPNDRKIHQTATNNAERR